MHLDCRTSTNPKKRIAPVTSFGAILLFIAFTLRGADFPKPYDSGPVKSTPMPATEAAAKMTLPPGFKATVFAAEPDVQNPIAMAWDARGRLWVAENYTYAEAGVRYDLKLRDRILIFEDTRGDGHFSSRRVFTDQLQMLTSIEVGHGGVWALALPNLVFIPDRNHTGIPDGPPEVVLDGFNAPQENYHNMASGLRFGPDGWLYGRCGARRGWRMSGAPGTAGRASACPSAAECGDIIPSAKSSKPSPPATPTPGATTGTSTANCST